MKIVSRNIQKNIERYKRKYPVPAVTGPCQSGKTTLLKNMFPHYTYLNLENPDTRDFAQNEPNGFFNQYNSKIILDETQHIASIFSYPQRRANKENGEIYFSRFAEFSSDVKDYRKSYGSCGVV